MHDEVELLLSDEFVAFSGKIADIHKQKKQCQEEFKKIFDSYKASMSEFEKAAAEAQNEWETWKTSAAEAKTKKKG
jgi:hypothetical protein